MILLVANKARRFRRKMMRIFIKHTDSRMTSEVFIKYIANTHLGLAEDELIIDRNEYGKPCLRNFPNIHYNISHTKGLIVCAIADGCVGIDVERVRSFKRGIVERFFSPQEREYIFASHRHQEERFAEIWTRKEAYVKWLGKGMAVPFESFDVKQEITEMLYSFTHDNCYAISVCCESLEYKNTEITMGRIT